MGIVGFVVVDQAESPSNLQCPVSDRKCVKCLKKKKIVENYSVGMLLGVTHVN